MTVWPFLSLVRGNFDPVWPESILHVDMDSFFVEVERLTNPDLRGRPVAVGGAGKRGVVASASYEARAYGVKSAQPTSMARRLCPELVMVAPSSGAYSDMSARVFEIFRSFTPVVEGLSLDEAFLDIGGLTRHFRSPAAVGEAVREAVLSETGLPASVGVASTKFVAKLASETAKPNGLHHVPVGQQEEFLGSLPIAALWGVGPATMAGLGKFGVETVGDLAQIPEATLAAALGPGLGRQLRDLSRGIDPRLVVPDSASRSISVEETFAEDMSGTDRIELVLLAQSQRLSDRLRRAGLACRTVTIKVRYSDFTTLTRSQSVGEATDSPHELFAMARGLLARVDVGRAVRLLGVGAGALTERGEPQQMRFGPEEQWRKVSDAMHEARQKFGPHAVEPARLLQIPGSETDEAG